MSHFHDEQLAKQFVEATSVKLRPLPEMSPEELEDYLSRFVEWLDTVESHSWTVPTHEES